MWKNGVGIRYKRAQPKKSARSRKYYDIELKVKTKEIKIMINSLEKFEEKELVEMARRQFLALLKMSGFGSTEQACVLGSHYLYLVLRKFSKRSTDLQICGGGYSPGTGAKTADGSYAKHMWVAGVFEGELWFFDITADQFGYPEIVCVKASEVGSCLIADHQEMTNELLSCMHRDDPVLAQMAGLKE